MTVELTNGFAPTRSSRSRHELCRSSMVSPARLLRLAALFIIGILAIATARAESRIKDLVDVEGVRENQLLGYGLVVGLNGTGDTLNNTAFTKQSLQAMLERLGVNTH